MSVERSMEAWEEVQRQGQDLADRLAQGITGLIQTPSFPWPNHQKLKLFDLEIRDSRFVIDQPINGVSAILDIGNKIGQAGVDFGTGLNVMVQQLFRRLPIPFRHEENGLVSIESNTSTRSHMDSGTVLEEKVTEFDLRTIGLLGRPKTIHGTRITPMVNWPHKSFGIGVSQAVAWRKSGLMMKPAIQLSVCSTFDGINPGMKTEVIHSLNDNINTIFGCTLADHPSAFASLSVSRI